ncbi:hypothetical protein K7X08_025051 [Anisodus acutangulus]|uniref:WRKY domain-containing protein n=1 Tax=Anisodus acutangulus TaxID=402998 RepID=A0A9Q1MA08_9SOLA|nr:hypothetical protein K7X08_025051 [Anisodus acutangulus]
MGDDNWDIGAIVRGCNINRPNNVVPTFENDHDDWDFFYRLLDDDQMTNFQGLGDIFSRTSPVAQQQNSDDLSFEIINPTSSVPIFADQVKIMDQNDNQQLLQPAQLRQQIIFPPPPPTALTYVQAVAPQELIYPQQQLAQSVRSTPVIQTRRRKNQSIKIIYELRQEELTDDTWAWRKYGQKPIKSSPFPRNYYMCNTSKGCKAKKHIEKSPKAQDLFVVAYYGEHDHPPPVNKSCRAGCARGTKSKLPRGISIFPRALSSKSSSPSSVSRRRRYRSSVTPLSPTPTLEIQNGSPNKDEMVDASQRWQGRSRECCYDS